jgi:hypothetical protein
MNSLDLIATQLTALVASLPRPDADAEDAAGKTLEWCWLHPAETRSVRTLFSDRYRRARSRRLFVNLSSAQED